MLAVEDLYFTIGGIDILKAVGFEWSSGLLAIIGSNGSGKSTLLRCLASSTTPSRGTIHWNGAPIASQMEAYRGLLGYAPQGRTLKSRLTAAEFLVTCASLRRLHARHMMSEAVHALSLVGLDDHADAPLDSLSGGSLRKLLTAQALIGDPKLVILDEPTSEVDEATAQIIWDRLKDYARTVPVIVASHDLKSALDRADGVAEMKAGILSAIDAPVRK